MRCRQVEPIRAVAPISGCPRSTAVPHQNYSCLRRIRLPSFRESGSATPELVQNVRCCPLNADIDCILVSFWVKVVQPPAPTVGAGREHPCAALSLIDG